MSIRSCGTSGYDDQCCVFFFFVSAVFFSSWQRVAQCLYPSKKKKRISLMEYQGKQKKNMKQISVEKNEYGSECLVGVRRQTGRFFEQRIIFSSTFILIFFTLLFMTDDNLDIHKKKEDNDATAVGCCYCFRHLCIGRALWRRHLPSVWTGVCVMRVCVWISVSLW